MPKQAQDQSEDWSKAKKYALDLLSRREHSCLEIKRKLSRRSQFSELDLDSLCEQLKAAGWLSHERYAEAFIRSRRTKGQGPTKITHELRSRGLNDQEFNSLIEAYDDWLKIATDCLFKRFKKPSDDPAERLKWNRFLAQRGFNFETVSQACQQFLRNIK